MDELLIEDVRCFRGQHRAPLAPLTLLVGENSSGKSTFLALARVAWDLAFGHGEPDFNEDPFLLGAYEDIAHYHGGRGARTRTFSVGFSDRRSGRGRSADDSDFTVKGTFSPAAGQPALSDLHVTAGRWEIHARQPGEGMEVILTAPNRSYEMRLAPEFPVPSSLSIQTILYWVELFSYGEGGVARAFGEAGPRPEPQEARELLELLERFVFGRRGKRRRFYSRPIAMAPVRTRPKRTYDPVKEARSSEGDHVPMLMARLKSADESLWTLLIAQLSDYGKKAGLFEELEVHRYASSESAPFQLRVKLAGHRKLVNLVDVGYGVSQILPILVDSLLEEDPATFLVQQPEVHLHPRAQAELGTLFATLLQTRGHRFMIETHSDHLVDRVRLEVRQGRLSADDVRILYLERMGSQACIHEIRVDSGGNIIGQPVGYREFFLNEELRMLLPA